LSLGPRGRDDGRWILGAVGCAVGNVGELATHLETRFQGQAVCIHDEPANDGEDRVKNDEVCSGSTSKTCTIIFYSTQVCAGQHQDGLAQGVFISLVFRPPVRNDMVKLRRFRLEAARQR